jgi:tRNA A37 methylthiotransferase MiaB
MNKKKIFIYGILTCNRRKLDAQKIQEYFIRNNYEIVNNPKDANIIILSSCAYSNKNAKKSLELTKKFLKFNTRLIVTGCLPEIDKEELLKFFNGEIISTQSIDKFDIIFPENKVKIKDIEDANIPLENANVHVLIYYLNNIFKKFNISNKTFNNISESFLKNMIEDNSVNCHENIIKYFTYKFLKEKLNPNISVHKDSFFIRPSWGCLGNCSYCVIKKAIGPLKSKPLDSIIAEFNKGLNQGYKNFIFDADDLGAYGVDIGSNFVEMLDNITEIQGDYLIHLRYIQPIWIVKYLNDFIKVLKKGKIKSLGSAIQSGSPRILKLMNRYPDTEKIKNSFLKIKIAYPNLLLATECIIGFPSETNEEFEETLNVIKEISFDWGYIIPFSCRLGSKAENLDFKIPKEEILNRIKNVKEYLKTIKYDSSSIRHLNILTFSKTTSDKKLDDGAKSFCFSTIE